MMPQPTITRSALRPAAVAALNQVIEQGVIAIITEHGHPVAEIHPYRGEETPMPPLSNAATARELLFAYLDVFHGDRKRIRRQLRAEIDQRLAALDLLDENPTDITIPNSTT